MIVRNEAACLGRCLDSVHAVVDQIVIVDTGSSDATIAIARQYRAEVIEADWKDDFAFSRNISIEHATGTWILWLDADDVVPEESLSKIQKLKEHSPDRVFGFIVRNERPGNTGTEFTQARMFPNKPEIRFERRIHEQIMPSALRQGFPLEQCDIIIEHHGYADPEGLRKKALRNVRLLLQEYPLVAPDVVMATEIADSYTLCDNENEAEAWYKKVIQIPDSKNTTPVLAAHAHFGIGNIENRRECYSEAKDHFQEALRLTPWRSDVLYSLAVTQELSGDSDSAVATLRKIPSIKPTVGQVGVDFRTAVIKSYLRCVRLLVELDRLSEAKEVVAEAVERVIKRPEIHSMAGKFFLKTGLLLEALHSFEKSITIHRDGNLEAYIGLCLIYHRAQRDELVRETFKTIAPAFKGDERYYFARHRILGESLPIEFEYENARNREKFEIFQRDFWGLI
jgi:glycosyltransferase involved in cell wall biosynthesis